MSNPKNVLTVKFGTSHTVTADALWQYDYGQILKMTGVELPLAYEVHFAKYGDAASVTQIGDADGVDIPDSLLQTPGEILAWLYLHEGESDGETLFQITIPVQLRAEPTNDEPTPVQQDAITEAIAALNTAVTTSGASATSAAADALKAEGYAVGKQNGEAVSSGTYYRNNAEYYADQASSSATTASTKAGEASGSASAASGSATSAAADALVAEGYAVGSQNGTDVSSGEYYQNNAKYYAGQASNSASTAASKATQASNSASTASTKASQASNNALSAYEYASGAQAWAVGTGPASSIAANNHAKYWANEAATSASAASDSATTASEKAGDAADSATSASSSASTAISKASDASDSASAAASSASSAAAAQSAIENMTVSATTLDTGESATVTKTTSGGVVNLEFGLPRGTAGQNGTNGTNGTDGTDGYSPTATVTKSGDTATISITDKNGTTTATVSDGTTPTIDDALSDSSENPVQNKVVTGALSKKADGIIATATGAVASFADGADGLPVHDLTIAIDPVQSGSGDPSPDNVRPITGSTGANVYREDEYDAEADPTVTVSWQEEAGTIYGGTLDVTTGVLTATMATKTLDDALNWSKSSAGNVYYYSGNATSVPYAFKSGVAALSDRFKFNGTASSGYSSALSNGEFLLYYSSTPSSVREIAFKNESISTLDAWKTAVHDDPIQIVYELATPVTYQLTPQQLTTLLGDNAIWADTGDVSVQYYADTKTYVDDAANLPIAGASTLGGIKVDGYGVIVNSETGLLTTDPATGANVKAGSAGYKPLTPGHQHEAAFFGLAKAAGDATQSESNNAVGTYTESAKSKISEMLGGSVAVSGSTPSITAQPGIRYVCGEVSTLDITLPASGIVDVVFESGSTATVLTVTPPTGVTAVKWANGFDPTSLEANTTYEINIEDGKLGVAMAWT